MTKELKGIHVLLIVVGAFSIVVAANLTMLFSATGSFPGLVVKNSYVASQQWNARTEAQNALGWKTSVGYVDGTVTVKLTDTQGAPVTGLDLAVTIGRPTRDNEDRMVTAVETDGLYRVPAELTEGRWRIAVATATGPAFEKIGIIQVRR